MLRKLGSFLSKDGKEDGNVHSFDDLQTVFSPSTKGENRKRRTRDKGEEGVENVSNVNVSELSTNDVDCTQPKKVRVDVQRKKIVVISESSESVEERAERREEGEKQAGKKYPEKVANKVQGLKRTPSESKWDGRSSDDKEGDCSFSASDADNQKVTADRFFSKVRHNHLDVIKEMLQNRNFDLLERDDRGNTALIVACQNNHKKIASLLIAHGVELNAVNNKGLSALDTADVFKFTELAQYVGVTVHHKSFPDFCCSTRSGSTYSSYYMPILIIYRLLCTMQVSGSSRGRKFSQGYHRVIP